jgi:hypothetical protein
VLTPGRLILADPLNETPPIVLAVCNAVAVVALPLRAAVTVPALKLPDASLATIALAVLVFVAVVAELDTFPAVAIVASFVSAIAAEALTSASTIDPAVIPAEIVMFAPPLNDVAVPVTSPLIAIVLAVCKVVAVVAFPERAAVTVPAVKLPLASLATIALAVFVFVAVVAEFETLSAVDIVASLLSGMLACSLADDTDNAPRALESTAPAAIDVDNATLPDPLNEVAGAVIEPVREKSLFVVSVAALPVVFWLPAVLTPGKLILADPLKLTPPMVLAVVNVAALPVVFWLPAVLTPGKLILADPLNDTPPIVLAVCRVVAVDALPSTVVTAIAPPPLIILDNERALDDILVPYDPAPYKVFSAVPAEL